MVVDWKWLAAWAGAFVVLETIAEVSPGLAGPVGLLSVGLMVTVLGELLVNGSLKAGLQRLGVPIQ